MSANNTKSPTSNTKPNRLPAPTLFVGPPSRNASQLSVIRPPAADNNTLKPTTRDALARQPSTRSRRNFDPTTTTTAEDAAAPKDSRSAPRQIRKPSDRSIDARWREMQSTLNEVELTAQSSTHVFGEGHARALDDLRDAQIALARAWGRGNEGKDEASREEGVGVGMDRFKGAQDLAEARRKDTAGVGAAGVGMGFGMGVGMGRKRADTEASASTVLSDESALSDSTSVAGSGRSALEDETAQDIRLASERRAANESYFRRVDEGVREVVERLEKVAEAMRGVEGEGRSLWGDSSSSRSGSEGIGGGAGGEGSKGKGPEILVEGEG